MEIVWEKIKQKDLWGIVSVRGIYKRFFFFLGYENPFIISGRLHLTTELFVEDL